LTESTTTTTTGDAAAEAGTAIARLDTVSLDAHDPLALARFYSAVLGLPLAGHDDDSATLERVGGVGIMFLKVPADDHKTVKDRVHLDLEVDDPEAAAKQCEDLGATRVTDGPLAGPFPWIVMHDPEGHEFCLCPSS
jgi:predicted enzyme related to lactoylglutathione lyase